MSKIPRCEKTNVFRPGDASLSCALPAGHDGRCEVAEVCPTCHGTGRTGKRVEVADQTAAPAIAQRAAGA